jgi:Flp pilus assembly pilin Flp
MLKYAAFVHSFALEAVESLRKRQEGQTMAEYAVILTVISVLVLTALLFLGGKITGVINRVGSAIN